MFLCIAHIIVNRDLKIFACFKQRSFILIVSATILSSFLLLLPLMLPYIKVAREMGMRKFESAVSTIPRLRSYFFATSSSSFWNVLSKHGEGAFPDWWNHYLFVGALP